MKSLNAKNLIALSSLALLTACGGGSEGGSTTTTATSTTTTSSSTATQTTSTASTLVTSVPKTTYAGEELAAFELLNKEREHCGFGLLAQNAKLDVAARGHADYLLLNNSTGHYQVAGNLGFTGIDPTARVIASGYNNGKDFTGGEVERDISLLKEGQGEAGVRSLYNAPYHLELILAGNQDVGVSVRDVNDLGLTSSNRSVVNLEFGYLASVGPQRPASKNVRTYPCEGSTGVKSLLRSESPNPVPGRNLSTNPLGSNIGIIGDAGKKLVITSASMTTTESGLSVKLLPPVTSENDPNKRLASHEGFIMSDSPLQATTAYIVKIEGTNDGSAFMTSFTFTTGSSN